MLPWTLWPQTAALILAKTRNFATEASICLPSEASQGQDWFRRSFGLPIPRAQGITQPLRL